MSWRIVNRILGLAAADPMFWRELQCNPLGAIRKHGFELTVEESEAFRALHTEDLAVFCQCLLAQLTSADEENHKDTI